MKNVKKTGVEKEVVDYLINAEQHVFTTKYYYENEFDGKSLFKVIPILSNNNVYVVLIKIGVEKVVVSIMDTSWVITRNHLGMFKNQVFPQYVKHKSIKKINSLEEKFDKIREFANENNSLDIAKLKEEFESILSK